MKRSIVLMAGLVMFPFVGSVPAADATGGSACTITGTITFSASSVTAAEGRWAIGPAVISCHGLFNGYERILGPGPFSGSGAYTAFPSGSGTCLHNVGTGTIDYHFPTTASDIHLVEPSTYTLAGAGALSTPSLNGTFQVAPTSGNCVTASVTSALFVAEAVLVRFVPPDPNRYLP